MSGFNTKPPRTESCEIHGGFESKHVFGDIYSTCPICSELEAELAKKAKAESDHSFWMSRVSQAGVPERFRDRTLENYIADTPEQRRALEFSIEFASKFDEVLKTGRSAMFVGRPGTGKTHLATGILRSVLQPEHRTGMFTTVQRAMRRIKDTWAKGSSETESKAIWSLSSPDLLVLDEIGVQFGSEFEKQTMFDVLNERYERRKPVLLLSNLDVKEVSVFLGERIMDRLREDASKLIVFNWESRRGKLN